MPETISHKICRRCKEDKAAKLFPKNKQLKDGLHSYCKKCQNALVRKSTFSERGVSRRRSYLDQEWYRERARAYNLKYYRSKKGQKIIRKHMLARKHSMKTLARRAVNHAIEAGKIIRPNQCFRCDDPKVRIEAHHYLGYERKHWFDIEWICSKCHGKTKRNWHEEVQDQVNIPTPC